MLPRTSCFPFIKELVDFSFFFSALVPKRNQKIFSLFCILYSRIFSLSIPFWEQLCTCNRRRKNKQPHKPYCQILSGHAVRQKNENCVSRRPLVHILRRKDLQHLPGEEMIEPADDTKYQTRKHCRPNHQPVNQLLFKGVIDLHRLSPFPFLL